MAAGVNQPGSFHGKIDRRGIDRREIDRLSPAQKREVQEAWATINDPTPLPAGASEYKQAWKSLLKNLPPRVSLLLMMNSFRVMPPEGNSYRDQITALTEERFAHLVRGADYCFSSRQYDYPKKQGEFWWFSNITNPDNLVRGWEYLPLIDKSLRSGNCLTEDVIAIMNDLIYLGPPLLNELIDLIASEHWDDSPEFARAYLKLTSHVPFPEERTDEEIKASGFENTEEQVEYAWRLKEAMLALIPSDSGQVLPREDQDFIMNMMARSLGYLSKTKKDSFFQELITDPKIKSRPDLEGLLRKRMSIWL